MKLWLNSPDYILPTEITLTECYKCKRKILVSQTVNGFPHHCGTSACCVDCYDSSVLQKKFPKEYEAFIKWKDMGEDES